jgi:hypothetical protein
MELTENVSGASAGADRALGFAALSRRKLPTGLSAAAEPEGRCSAPGTDNVLGKGMALLPDRPTQPGLPRLEATLKGTGERGGSPCPRFSAQ